MLKNHTCNEMVDIASDREETHGREGRGQGFGRSACVWAAQNAVVSGCVVFLLSCRDLDVAVMNVTFSLSKP